MNLRILARFPGLVAGTAVAALALASSRGAEEAATNRHAATDAVLKRIAANISDLKTIAVIDHSRLAEKEGVTMPSSVVTIYSDPKVDSALMRENPRVGLDLPQKILVFDADGEVRAACPHSSFLAARHGITDKEALALFDERTGKGLRGIDGGMIDRVSDVGVTRDLGITDLASDFGYAETIQRLREAVMMQGDTVWFGEIDFHSLAAEEGVDLPRSTLLLFGGPKPGGVAMAQFPQLGLDAFCQKLLVYEDGDNEVRVIFNDIVAMAKLHYGRSAEPHAIINGRLTTTFEGAIRRPVK